jgi:hypothetical protein
MFTWWDIFFTTYIVMYQVNVLPSKLNTGTCCFKLVPLYTVLFLTHCWLTLSPGMAGCSVWTAVSWFYIIWGSHSDLLILYFVISTWHSFGLLWSFLATKCIIFVDSCQRQHVSVGGPCYIRGASNCQFLDLGTTKFASLVVLIIAPGWYALLSHVQVAQGLNMCPRFFAM